MLISSIFAAMSRLWVVFSLLFTVGMLYANGIPEGFVRKVDAPIVVDGNLDEAVWSDIPVITDFWQHFPVDSLHTEFQTEIRMIYTDDFLYIAAKCYAPGDEYITPSLKRDYRAGGNDNITFLFDPFNDGANAYVFGINPFGVLREALISEGGQQFSNFRGEWDNKWDGAAQIHDDHWSLEVAIPFSTLRYNEGSKKWRFNCYRFDTQTNEIMTWARIPRNQSLINLAFMGDLHWDEPLQKNGSNIAIIPYVSLRYVRDRELDPEFEKVSFGAGGDAKIAITPGLNLDLTINPDFSQVEVDQEVVNLTRFEIFLPERRQFFIENSDLFGSFGFGRINPFFSRRIGIIEDTATERNIENPILLGARLNGKVNDDLRIGVMNITTEDDPNNGLPTFNYTVLTSQHKVGSRSNIGAIFVNKQAIKPRPDDLYDPYNRVVGIDYNLLSPDNRWTGKTFVHKMFGVTEGNDTWAHGARLEYRVYRWRARWSHAYTGADYDPEVGFVPRNDYFRIDPEVGIFFYPKSGPINNYEVQFEGSVLFKPGFGRSDHDYSVGVQAQMRNNTRFNININHRYVYLFEEFDPTGTDQEPLPANTDYNMMFGRMSYRSDQRKAFFYNISAYVGEFFNGYRGTLGGSANYRFQPYGSVGLTYNLNYINLPDPYATELLVLVGPRIDITFSRSLFFTTILQYNDQNDNININSRLQWRFKPVSDIFLVYTDNFGTNGYGLKNRSIVFKATYWLNI